MGYPAKSGMKYPDQTEQTDYPRDYPTSQPYPQDYQSPEYGEYGRPPTEKMADITQLQDKISKYSYDGKYDKSSDRYAPSTDKYDIATYNLPDTDRNYKKGGAAQSSYQAPGSPGSD